MSEDEPDEPEAMDEDVKEEPAALRALRQLFVHKGAVNPKLPKVPKLEAPKGKVRCPVCKKCVPHDRLKKHVENHHAEQLKPGNKHRPALEALFRAQAKYICGRCHGVSSAMPGGVCPKCDKLRSLDSEGRTEAVLSDEDKEAFRERILKRRKQRLTTCPDLPTKALRRQHSDAMLATASKLANAKNDLDEWRAHFEMATIKALRIRPLGAGKQKRPKNNKLTSKLLKLWEEGKRQTCWDIAKGIEDRRVAGRKKRWKQM